jgi:hypothetical protein
MQVSKAQGSAVTLVVAKPLWVAGVDGVDSPARRIRRRVPAVAQGKPEKAVRLARSIALEKAGVRLKTAKAAAKAVRLRAARLQDEAETRRRAALQAKAARRLPADKGKAEEETKHRRR